MDKVVRWRGKFADIEDTIYVVDIYGDGESDGTGTIKEIELGGDAPLVTNNDDSDDLFAAKRHHYGTLEIVDPDGTLMMELLPKDNIDHPVKVWKAVDESVVWEGFLGCDVYNEDFTDVGQVVAFQLVGLLGASEDMDVEVRDYTSVSIRELLTTNIRRMGEAMGGEVAVLVPENDLACLDVRVYASTMYNYDSEYNAQGIKELGKKPRTVLSMIESVCKSFGWCAREVKCLKHLLYSRNTAIVFGKVVSDSNYVFVTPDTRPAKVWIVPEELALAEDIEWAGDGHARSVNIGARSVMVEGTVERDEFKVEVGECPSVPEREFAGPSGLGTAAIFGKNSRMYLLEQTKMDYDARVVLGSWMARKVRLTYHGLQWEKLYAIDYQRVPFEEETGDLLHLSAYSVHSAAEHLLGTNTDTTDLPLGARYCRYAVGYEADGTKMEFKDGIHLYCGAISEKLGNSYPISLFGDYPAINMATEYHHFRPGYVKFGMNAIGLGRKKTGNGNANDRYVYYDEGKLCDIMVVIQVGDLYLSSHGWTDQFAYMMYSIGKDVESGDGIYLDQEAEGVMRVRIFPLIATSHCAKDELMTELLLSDISIDFEEEEKIGDEKKSTYYRQVGAGREDIKVEVPYMTSVIAGSCKNALLDVYGNNIDTLRYENEGTMRVEMNMLGRLESHYSAPKELLKIESSPLGSPDALSVVTHGEGENKRRYMVVESSRDWLTGVSELTLLEE